MGVSNNFKIAIIGAGASGIFCATLLASLKIPLILFDKNKTLGKKLLATGNGHCNIHNKNLKHSYYQSTSFTPQEIQTILNNFDYFAFEKHCKKIGLFLECKDNGKIYPASSSAKSVINIFESLLKESHISLKLQEEILSLSYKGESFCLQSTQNSYTFSHVILACGSEASPKLGGSDKGLLLAQKLGLEILPTYPSLVPLKLNSTAINNLSGIKIKANITLKDDDATLFKTYDDILFTNYGVSGFGILDLSSYLHQTKNPKIILDLLPNFSSQQLEKSLIYLIKSYPNRSTKEILSGFIHPKLAQLLSENLKLKITNTKTIKHTIYTLKNLLLDSPSYYGFESAEVSGGGVSGNEISKQTFESKKFKNLYLIGEMLDIVGNRGGYNLAFAWASAWACTKAISTHLEQRGL